MKPSHYPFLALILTSNLLMGQSYLSQDEVSLFGMRLMDNALDHITLDELNSKFEYGESDELFYRVLVTSKKNANFRRIFLVTDSKNIIHSISGYESIDASIYECKEKLLKRFVDRFEQKYFTSMQAYEWAGTSFINHVEQADLLEGSTFRFQCQEHFSGENVFSTIFQTYELQESINRFYDEGF